MVLDSVRKQRDVQFKTEEEVLQANRGVKFSDDHQTLVVWSVEKRDKTRMQEISTAKHTSALTVFRASEVGSKKIIGMATEMLKFGGVVFGQEEDFEQEVEVQKFQHWSQEQHISSSDLTSPQSSLMKKESESLIVEISSILGLKKF